MDWWRDNFWLILAVAIIFVSAGLGIILFCVCRRLLRQGMTVSRGQVEGGGSGYQRIQAPLGHKASFWAGRG